MSTNAGGASASNNGLGLLAPCGMCGGADGYSLREGATYRWWNVQCNHCGRIVDECASDRRTQLGTELPERWPTADEAWNNAGAHAEALRKALRRVKLEAVSLADAQVIALEALKA